MADPTVLSFDQFWRWLLGHPNCILSVGSLDAVIYDHEDFHWNFLQEDQGDLLVQTIRGKQLIGEIVIPRRVVTHVQVEERTEEECLFECFIDGPDGPLVSYAFTLSHGYTPEDEPAEDGEWVH